MSARAEADTVAVEVREGIAWVRFNRPEKRNAMSPGLNRQMLRVINELEFREEVGVLVLAGEGVAWSAGMDLKEYFRETEARGLSGVRHSQREAGTIERRRARAGVRDLHLDEGGIEDIAAVIVGVIARP